MNRNYINNNLVENCNGIDCIKVRAAVIDEITYYRDNYLVTVSYWTLNEDDTAYVNTVRLVVSPDTVITDTFGRRKCARDLKESIVIDVDYSIYMTMSIPPQVVAYRIVIN